MILSFRLSLRRARDRVPAPLLLVASMLLLHTGSAVAVHLFDTAGPAGVTWLRLSWAALLLLAVGGRSLGRAVRTAAWRDIAATAVLGTVSAGMMVLFALATDRVPLGTAAAVEFLGPLTVAVLALRRRREALWILLAAGGVLLLTRPWRGDADLTGVAFGLAGAACVALYIVLSQRVGSRLGVLPGLTLAMTVSALVTAPLGLPDVIAAADPRVVAVTLGTALIHPLLPLLLEMAALQRMSRGAFSVLGSVDPAIGLLVGVLLIGQVPVPVQVAGMALVVVAGLGATRADTAPRRSGPGAAESGAAGSRGGEPGGAARRRTPTPV
ncbi:EamA family transporter [Thermobifida halotolerans]|uniref:EamA family transporter n=1 Tax=Thermobifida halotolerans TaxID=483545 RepID=A0AA97M4T9_9ACTN|nr:EamA family transporter [Thermobifida halotolerans]UOE20558.1 EamA family transporter [Thermobifida halotolerans]